MLYELDAIYENGMLKLDHPLPLEEQQRVRIVVQDRFVRSNRERRGIGGQYCRKSEPTRQGADSSALQLAWIEKPTTPTMRECAR
ncbi:MAG TPA: antitoxin family protein [Pirellulales bacterium]|nr:antitoxin family protein [Pirellulales bacterium]